MPRTPISEAPPLEPDGRSYRLRVRYRDGARAQRETREFFAALTHGGAIEEALLEYEAQGSAVTPYPDAVSVSEFRSRSSA
jgi:hypothetical protein